MEQSASRPAVQKTPGYAWIILLVVFLASFAVPLNMFKVPPVAPMMFGAFGLDPTTFGWLMSAFQVMGIFLAFPAAGLVLKFGLKPTTIVAVACCAAGSLIGTFAPNTPVLMLSRFVEGAGMAFFGVVAPVALSAWFPARRIGLAIGLWSIWMPLGSTLMFNLAPALAGDGNWQAVWWLATLYSVAALVLFALLFRMPRPDEVPVGPGGPGGQDGPGGQRDAGAAQEGGKPRIWSTQTVAGVVLLALMFTAVNVCTNGTLNTYFPTFLQTEHAMDPAAAGFVTSAITFFAILSSPVSGIVSDKLGRRKWIIALSIVLTAVAFWFAFTFTGDAELWFSVVVIGVFSATIATCAMSFVPQVVRNPAAVGMGMAALSFANAVGSFIGGMALGWLLPGLGWANGSHLLILPLLALGLVAVLLIRTKSTKEADG
jgi:MFS family permease